MERNPAMMAAFNKAGYDVGAEKKDELKRDEVKNGKKIRQNDDKVKNRQGAIYDNYNMATAPYNFVAMPNKAIEAPLSEFIRDEENRGVGFIKYIKSQGDLCGEIEYTLINLTPMYIGGDFGQFFAPIGKPIIPGSTMRGLVKNYLKIISCGTMRAENNEDITRNAKVQSSKIEEHIPVDLRNYQKIDFAEAIFGRKESWAGRVWFEDGYLKKDAGTLKASKPHKLMGPKPTSFQLYFQQNFSKYVNKLDRDAKIRGYKMYWHNDIDEYGWKSDSGSNGIIQPLRKGNVFQGKVRFNNLSKEELGALLAVFKLSEQGCFKIGMGKPIGMGSVKCQYNKLKLNLIDSSKLYTKLFEGDGWNIAMEKTDTDPYITAFNAYIRKQVAKLNITEEYEQILKTLSIMMSWENTKLKDWSEKTKYMPLRDSRYKDRVPLPTPSEVVDSDLKKK